jgi:hypothetical protein
MSGENAMNMETFRRYLTAAGFAALVILAGMSSTPRALADVSFTSRLEQSGDFTVLPAAGKKCQIDDEFYFVYEFVDKPKMGLAILRVQVFDHSGNKSNSFRILGRSDMPSMAGAHDSGDQEFKLNKKNDYLLPVNIVMPGEWEVKLTFRRDETSVFKGVFRFDV